MQPPIHENYHVCQTKVLFLKKFEKKIHNFESYLLPVNETNITLAAPLYEKCRLVHNFTNTITLWHGIVFVVELRLHTSQPTMQTIIILSLTPTDTLLLCGNHWPILLQDKHKPHCCQTQSQTGFVAWKVYWKNFTSHEQFLLRRDQRQTTMEMNSSFTDMAFATVKSHIVVLIWFYWREYMLWWHRVLSMGKCSVEFYSSEAVVVALVAHLQGHQSSFTPVKPL